MRPDAKIYIAGHRGTAGSAILRRLQEEGFHNILTRTHAELDLTRQAEVEEFFAKERPEFVFFAAARLGNLGIRDGADIFYENLMMQNNVLHNAFLAGVKKLIFFGSSWMYPKEAKNPIKEESLLERPLDYVAEPYALSKIAGLKMAQSYNLQHGTNFICVALTNLYGETKNFDFKTAKVLPAMLRKFHLAKLLSEGKHQDLCLDLWGGGVTSMRLSNASKQRASMRGASRFGVVGGLGANSSTVAIWPMLAFTLCKMWILRTYTMRARKKSTIPTST